MRKKENEKKREEKAITLIALIITIVVLLILAVVAINAVTGEGIIQHATNAKTQYQNAQKEENSTIQGYVGFLENEVAKIDDVKLITFKIDFDEYTAEKGMNFYEWCNSKYNDSEKWVCESLNGEVTDSGTAQSGYNLLYKTINSEDITINGDDIINENTVYKVGRMGATDEF